MEDKIVSAVQQTVDQGVGARSVPFDWQGKRYWIKIALREQANNWHRFQNLFAGLLRCPMLRATVSDAMDDGLNAEARRLRKIATRGVRVPSVIAQRPGWILLDDIGDSLFEQINGHNDPQTLILKAADALSTLHHAGGWHGTGQLRDMILCPDGEIGFIDFEENVGEAMDASAAQARDILRFLISSIRFDGGDGALLRAIMEIYQAKSPTAVWPHIRGVIRWAIPLTFLLKPFRKKLGRDLRHALLVIEALKGSLK